jgi:signal peptidase
MNGTGLRQQLGRAAKIGGALVLTLVFCLTAIVVQPQVVGASHSYVVTSGSMSPAIDAGDVVIVRDVPASAISTGDVITFARSPAAERPTTHRVVAVTGEGEDRAFRTKGDANEEADRSLVSTDQVVGRVWFHVPDAGYPLLFGSTKEGLLALLVVPLALLVVSETVVLVRAARPGPPDGHTQMTEQPPPDPPAVRTENSESTGDD